MEFINQLKETRKELHLHYSSILEVEPTNHGSDDIYNYFVNKLVKYYSIVENFLGKKQGDILKYVKKNNYFLYDDFNINSFSPKNEDSLDSVIFSPFSINFFSKVFKNVLSPYFTTEKDIPKADEELISILIMPILTNIDKNMEFCPAYLKEILQKGFNGILYKIKPETIFFNIIIDKIFENPHLFNILDYNQTVNANNDDLDRLKAAIHDQLQFNEGMFSNDAELKGLPSNLKHKKIKESKDYNDSLKSFKTLLTLSHKEIPDEIPENILKANLADQIKFILIDETDPHYSEQIKPIFESLQEKFREGDFLKKHIEQSINEIRFQIAFTHYKHHADRSIKNLRIFIKTISNDKCMLYLNDPHIFLNDFILYFTPDKETFSCSLDDSQITASNDHPFFLSMSLLRGSSIKKFISIRHELFFAERTFKNELESKLQNKNENIFPYKPLVDFKNDRNSEFQAYAKEFADAFTCVQNPYNMMELIDETYDKIKKETIGDIDENEKINFTITLFNLTKPKNVISTFVFLYDYIFAPVYYDYYELKENTHYDSVKKIMVEYFKWLYKEEDLVKLSKLCKICQFEVNLVLKKDKNFLNDLAKVIALNETEENAYKNMFIHAYDNPLVKNEPAQFIFRVYANESDVADDSNSIEYGIVSLDENDLKLPKIWICHVTSLADNGYDQIDISNKNSLIKSLIPIYEAHNEFVMDNRDELN